MAPHVVSFVSNFRLRRYLVHESRCHILCVLEVSLSDISDALSHPLNFHISIVQFYQEWVLSQRLTWFSWTTKLSFYFQVQLVQRRGFNQVSIRENHFQYFLLTSELSLSESRAANFGNLSQEQMERSPKKKKKHPEEVGRTQIPDTNFA